MNNDNKKANGITGTGMFVSNSAAADALTNDIDELKALDGMTAAGNIPVTTTAQTVLHKAGSRGHADHGWLKSNQTFSFADYYNPNSMHFGALRVLNDDWVAPGMGFGRHPHDNMEIISIPLEGTLEHADSMNNKAIIEKGDIQAMSAGTGIFHTEYNKSKESPASFLQIWVFPRQKNVAPRYDQQTLNSADRHNKLQQVLSPNANDEGVWIHQDAWFHIGNFDGAQTINYPFKKEGNGLYAFVIKGEVTIEGQVLNERDGLGVWNTSSVTIQTNTKGAEILLMEVPMSMS